MYPSKGGNPYGQNTYAAQQAYTQQLSAAGYPSGSDAATSQHALAARQAMMGASQEADFRGQVPQYGGAYAAVYGNAALSSSQQAGGASSKESVPSSLHGRASYSSALAEASKFSSGGSSMAMNNDDYLSASNRAYNQKSSSDYAREYAEHQAALEDDTARRYADPVALNRQHQASLLRQQQLVKAQMLSGSDIRQADYHAARVAPIHPGTQELGSYAGRLDVDPRNLSAHGGTPYGGQHAGSILGEAPRRNVDNHIYAQGPAAAAYGVGLPPGRDYVSGKGLRGPSLEPDYPGRRGAGASMFDERKDDRSAFHRDMEVRDDERRRELFREREKDREREERERERERERVRERDRERERERERDRVRERRDRDRERERDRKRATAPPRRERSPPRSARDRQGSSLPRDERSSRRITPRRETTVHRRHSPVKEKKREYVCKVYPFCFVDVQRDYLSLNKRYPRLSISPDFSKVVFNWPKENLNLSLHTPVSFEHDFIEIEKKNEDKGSIVALDESAKAKAKGVSTVWNAKVILMSGISTNALEELSSAKSPDRRIVHLNNILKFAILRKDHSYMAIGGPWDPTIDGGDPSVDHCSLIPTALRHLKDVTQLDLQKCSNWNPFLEIHYDRVGKDGLFSHKEITVLFLPDLSECLPSLGLWRTQWLAYVKDAAQREKQRASKLKKSIGNEAVPGEKGREKIEKDNISPKKVKVEDTVINEKADKMDLEGSSIEKKLATKGADKGTDKTNDDKSETKKDVSMQKGKGPILDEKQAEKKGEGAVSLEVPIIVTKKPTVKKIVKRKVAGKKTAVEDGTIKPDEKTTAKIEEVEQSKQEVTAQEIESSANPVKTYAKKKITKKVPAGKTSDLQSEKKTELEESKDKAKEPEVTAAVPETEVKTTGKKKVIRRIIKRKVSGAAEKDATATTKKAGEKDDSSILPGASKGDDTQLEVAEKAKFIDAKTTEDSPVKKENTTETLKKDSPVKKENTTETLKKDAKEAKVVEGKGESKSSGETKKEDSKKDAKSESKHKSHKDVKQIGIPEEPPRHPGFFLQTKQPIDSKERLRSMSLSLDGLLDYNDKDIEESTFELSLFAESLNEMLQYEMGSRILSFLEKLRSRYVAQKNQRKRQREENLVKERENEKDSTKRQKKSVGAPGENEPVKSENQDTSSVKNEEKMDEDACQPAPTESKVEAKTEDDVEGEEEDPEEELLEDGDPEMDGEMDDADSEDADNEDEGTDKITPVAPEKNTTEDDKKNEPSEKSNAKDEKSNDKAAISDNKSKKTDDKPAVPEKAVSVEPVVVNKELHQAFKFFDQNQVGYIKVEDLRCIIHNLGKFVSHRDVKEMVQAALFESSSARDNRIVYKKLTSMADII